MNKKETAQLIVMIEKYYPTRFIKRDIFSQNMSDEELVDSMVELWHEVLKDYDVNIIAENFKQYISANKFPPSVADLIKAERKDRAIPDHNETKRLIATWESEKANRATKQQADAALAEIRKALGIKRG